MRRNASQSSFWFAILAVSIVGCSSPPAPPAPPADSGPVVAMDSAVGDVVGDVAGPDRGAPEVAVAACTTDTDCANATFCDGAERCMPGAPGADARGCLAASAGVCLAGQRCDEAMRRCMTMSCATPDADGDGHRAAGCGGDDCDDGDALRYPGRMEVCDATDHDEDCDPTTFGLRDSDGDGVGDARCCNVTPGADGGARACGADCDDGNANVRPSQTEACNGVDDNCNGMVDEGTTRTVYPDRDGDGFGDALASAIASPGCALPAGTVENHTDCNDTAGQGGAIHPGATETCDGADNDCDGMVDESGMRTLYRDADGDGHGNSALPIESAMCATAGYVPNGDDCNDLVVSTYGGAPERCDRVDNNCSNTGAAAGGADLAEDADMDGHSPVAASCAGGFARDDCNDAEARSFPGNPEVCDRVDNNCSLPGAMAGGADLTEDSDMDGHSPVAAACTGGFARDDCNDLAAAAYMGAPEECDRIDTNCSNTGAAAGGADLAEDADMDGHSPVAAACMGGFARDDCDDLAAATYPGAPEVCDRIDTNCVGRSSGGADLTEDADSDGHSPTTATCAGGFARDDCNDMVATTYGGAPEACDRVDNNCSNTGTSAGGMDSAEDGDRDGHSPVAASCAGGFARDDCNDAEARSFPGNPEVCNGIDDNCAGGVDENPSASASCFYANGVGACGGGACAFARCNAGFGDCDVSPSNGCEVNLGTSPTNCGACGFNCGLGVACLGGRCATTSTLTGVSAGFEHTCAPGSGAVFCWGFNATGQLGDGTNFGRQLPVVVLGLTDAVEVFAGYYHTCAVRRGSGAVACWGSNDFGRLGDGTTAIGLTPTAVVGLTGAVEVSAGNEHTCARRGSGAVVCWGSNLSGQLGDGTATTRLTPVAVTGLTDAVGMSAGYFHTCALRSGGAVVCWGNNDQGQLGDGTTTSRSVPTAVAGVTDAVEVSTSGNSTCARRASGAVLCWGRNADGELGDGTGSGRLVPVSVVGLTDAAEISAGAGHTCARRASGAALCWGGNGHGEIGDGTTVTRYEPTSVVGLTDAIQVSAAFHHTCALRANGTALCWGSNAYGELGSGGDPRVNQLTPTPVLSP